MLALVAATCFLFAALPRLFNAFADDGLRYAVANAPFGERNPRLLEPRRVPAGPASDPLANVARRATAAQPEVLPPTLDELVVGRAAVIRTPEYVQSANAGLARYLTLQVAPAGVERQVRFVAGRAPRTTSARVSTTAVPSAVLFRAVTVRGPARTVRLPLLEVAVSTQAARELQVRAGDRLILQPAPQEIETLRVPAIDQLPLAVEIVGVFAVRDPQAPFWFGDTSLETPNVAFTAGLDTKLVHGQALVAPRAYPALLAATSPFRLVYEYRYPLDESKLDGGRLESLREAAQQIDARYAAAGPADPRVELGLGPILDRFRSARGQAETLLAVAAIGLLACALANLGLLGALTFERRGAETRLARVRGASPTQTLGGQFAEAVLIAVPAGVAGWGAAVLAIDGRGSALSAWLVAAIVATTVVLLVASIAGVARRPLGSVAPADVLPERAGRRRPALEALVAAAALGGVFLLRRRGLDSGLGVSGRVDPFLAAVPVLLGLAGGIAVMRLHPLPLAAAARLARRARGLALHLGLTRAARQPDTTSLPVLVLVVALAIATFAAVMSRTLEAGQSATGWRAVGADVRIDGQEGRPLPQTLVARLRGEGKVAEAYVQDADLSTGTEAKLLALDLLAYEAVVAGTPAVVSRRGALGKPSPLPSLVPALTSNDWPTPGTFQIPLPNTALNFVTVAERATLPGVPRGTPFAVVSLRALRDAGGQAPTNRLYVSGVGADAIRAAVEELAPGATLATRAAVAASLRASPLVDGVQRGFRWAIPVAAVFAAVALVLLVLIAARSRSRDLALVRTMGGAQRDTLVLAAVELTPLVVLGIAVGIGLGIAIPYVIEPGLDLAFFTGNDSSSIAVPGMTLLGLALGLLAFLGAAVLAVGWRARRADLGRVLRVGER